MKTKLSILLVLVTVTLTAVCVLQSRRLMQHRRQTELLKSELDQTSEQIHELQVSKERLIRQKSELLQQATENALASSNQSASTPVASLPLNNAPISAGAEKPATDPAGFGKILSKMMDDPATKQFMRDQQRMVMSQLYGPLFKQLGLTAQEGDKFKDLLADNAMKGAEKASSLFDTTGTNRTEALAAMTAEHNDLETQLRTLLGDTRYAQYQDYQQTAAERMQLNLFKQQSGGEVDLSDQQTEQLLGIMKEEKQNLVAKGEVMPTVGQDPQNVSAMFEEEKLQRLIENQNSINDRVYDRAKTVLSSEQLDSFARFQTNQLQMMRVGMTMARKMFAPEKP